MISTRRSVVLAMLVALSVSMRPASALDASYPSRPLTFVVPYPPGGAADAFARQLAQKLGERLGQSVVVENRAGANGNIGSDFVAKAPADGYTLLQGSASTIAINPALYGARMPYSPMKDLQPVSGTHSMANVLVVNTATPYKSVQDVIDAARLRPGTIAYASAGNGNTMHLAGVQFSQQAGVQLVHVPYRGGPPALNDVLGGQVPMMFNNLPAIVSLVRSGKLRALAIATRERSPVLPEVPTMEEAGLKGMVSTVWNGVFVKVGTSREIVDRLNHEIVAVLESPGIRQSLEEQGYDVIPSTPEQFAELIKTETVRWRSVVRQSGATID